MFIHDDAMMSDLQRCSALLVVVFLYIGLLDSLYVSGMVLPAQYCGAWLDW